ncbi:hypothetical protein FOHLNKBM_5673 [Methylobacterium longum]|nr:hypothetical protein FOHLNKBM_5673 [Methylobacterium longum]
MSASTRFLSAVAVAFVAGVASTSVYMSSGDAHKDASEAPRGAAPSIAERLRAEARGQSLPWSEPVKAKPEPSKLTFTPGPADAPAKGGGAVADEGRAPGPQAAPVPAPVRTPDDGARARVRLAQSDRQTPPPEEDQTGPAPALKRVHPSGEDLGPSRAKMVEAARPAQASQDDGARADTKLAQSSRLASQPGGEVGHSRAMSAETPKHVPPLVEEERTRVRAAEAPPRARPADAERSRLRVTEAPRRLRALDAEDDGNTRAQAAEARRPDHRSQPVPSRNLPPLAAANSIRAAVRRAEARRERVTVPPPYRTAGLEDRDYSPRVREVYVVRRDEEPDDEPRVRVRRSVAASDGLMHWLSGPDGRF